MHTYIHTYMHTLMDTCLHTYRHTCVHKCIHTYTHTYTYMKTYMHTYMHTCTHTYMHTCILTNIHACIHIYTPFWVGLVVSVSAPHTVGREIASRWGHTKDHHKNGTNFLPAWHVMRWGKSLTVQPDCLKGRVP